MPKQGQFARSQRHGISKSFRQHHQRQRQRTIDQTMVNDFLIVRYRLTTGKHLKSLDRETGQRFLQELTPRLQGTSFDLSAAVHQTLVEINAKVPWQFFYQLSRNWSLLNQFIQRELPALPLAKPVLLKNLVTQEELDQVIVQLLAQRIIGMTLLQRSVPATVQQNLIHQMVTSLESDAQIQWPKVAAAFKPWPFPLDEHIDSGTKDWLKAISQIHV